MNEPHGWMQPEKWRFVKSETDFFLSTFVRYLIWVGNGNKVRGEDNRDRWQEEVERVAHHCRKTCSQNGLDECVDSGDEQNCLDHPH